MDAPEICVSRPAEKRSDICIVIPTFNQYEVTAKSVALLAKQTVACDIVVVDNASTDGTYERLAEEFTHITLLKSKVNSGGSGGLYLGQKYAYERGYEYIVLSDNDAFAVDDNLIESIVNVADDSHIAAFVNAAEEDEPSIKIFHFGCYHRRLIERIGLVAYHYFIYGDDVEYEYRLRQAGVETINVWVRYAHPMKYHYPVNRVYFDIRNELENAKIYASRRKDLFRNLFPKFLFFKLYEPTKYSVMRTAIRAWQQGVWDNGFIAKKFHMDVAYTRLDATALRELAGQKELIVTYNKRLTAFLEQNAIAYRLYERKYRFGKRGAVLLHNSYIPAILFFSKTYYIVDVEQETGSIVCFVPASCSLLRKIAALLEAWVQTLKICRLVNRKARNAS